MLPARVVRVAELPLLPSGKLDRQALRERLAERERDDATTPDPTIPTARPRRSRDALELQLLAAWEKALGVEDIQPDEDFFALGGHSLAAAEVMVFIATHLGIELPLATLLEHPTLGALAAVIRQRGWSAAASPAVVVRAGSPLERPLFAVGGTGVEVVVFRELARELQPLPLIGLQHHAVRGEPLRLMSVAGMARDFLPHVLRLQPRGPYRLLGASFGGRVAFELARLLRARGEEVELLAMLDSYGPGYLRWRPSRDLRASLLALRHLLAPGTRWSRDVGVGPMARALGHVLKRAYVALRIGLGRTAPPAPQQRHLHAVAVADVAKLATRHRPIDARIDLFRAAIQPAKEATAPLRELGWAGRARRGVVVHDIPGIHGDYLRAPVAGLVAARIRTLLGAVAPAPEAVDTPLPERDELV
ncbi:MAG: thioesterase domain-containing protein [Myxococcota bacterium]